jgi:hypothetical protein
MSAKNCNWFLPTTALISVLLSVSTLSAQSKADLSRSGQWQIANRRTESKQYLEPASGACNQSYKCPKPKNEMGIHNRWRRICYSYGGW